MNAYEFIELKDEDFDPNTIVQDTPFTQAFFYGKWQEKMNREVKRFIVKNDNKKIAYFQIRLFCLSTSVNQSNFNHLQDFVTSLYSYHFLNLKSL